MKPRVLRYESNRGSRRASYFVVRVKRGEDCWRKEFHFGPVRTEAKAHRLALEYRNRICRELPDRLIAHDPPMAQRGSVRRYASPVPRWIARLRFRNQVYTRSVSVSVHGERAAMQMAVLALARMRRVLGGGNPLDRALLDLESW